MSILVIAEYNAEMDLTNLRKSVKAAQLIGSSIDILLAGDDTSAFATAASHISGIHQVVVVENSILSQPLAENHTLVITKFSADYEHFIFAATSWGKNVAPRVAGTLNVAQFSDVIDIESADVFVRPIYAGNAIAKVKACCAKKVLTIRSTAFSEAELGDSAAEIKKVSLSAINDSFDAGLSRFISEELSKSERPSITAASIIISGGRGMQNGANFSILERVADKLGAAVGASRAAVDAGFVSNDMQIGQTGKVVAPNLYIAVGISGAIQHLAGMKDSKIIVAINKDEEAPIFQIADYGLVGDLFDIMPELEAAL
ncbi:electron transfer flavoprotein subunit alpha/FixB family protein [Shewanella glacialipiscicola]|uniref:electron transfer flavoprotein subunit alpha/FixB family protein n=1 Tax=Shewanella glacialipiscicola TaxID=614069 RepID=UPI0021D8C05B|nr:FAD-binding protein [Shewanella glacialipiscicola]MCU7995485.1 FAD-binding protein [Shewanella glacialipiscicola]MCU8026732.1 FAD-binding protein [Shewanella glacialipiscicola]